jgi:hypothetical protein
MDGHHLSNITKLEKQSLCSDMVVPSKKNYTTTLPLFAKLCQKN